MTKNEAQNIEYLYRGRLFRTDEISPQGVVKIENDNFQPLIDSAIQAKGFAKGQERNSEIVGYNPDVLNEKLDDIFSGDYKKVFIIGFSNLSLKQKDYFEKFFELMPQDTFAITFSYNPDKDNVLAINIGNDYPQLYNIMQKIIQKFSITSDKLVFFLTKCDVNSLSNIIYLSNDINNTYNVPEDVYSKHIYIHSGNSSFKRVIGKSNNSIVYESLYIK